MASVKHHTDAGFHPLIKPGARKTSRTSHRNGERACARLPVAGSRQTPDRQLVVAEPDTGSGLVYPTDPLRGSSRRTRKSFKS